MRLLFVVVLMSVLLTAACEANPGTAVTALPTHTITPAVTPQVTPTLEPTPEEPSVIDLTVWWPERLAPSENASIQTFIDAQIAGFETAFPDYQIEFRRKRATDVGGIMSTLRSASLVAPGALPDLTLIRREDLFDAVQNRFVQPLEGQIPSGVLADLYDPALSLGWVNGELFGLPYLLEIQVFVYDGDQVDRTEAPLIWTFDTVLENELRFAFPAVRTGGVSDMFYLQYLSAGGTPPDDGVFTLDQDALRTTLLFYEQARDAGLIDAGMLELATTADYQAALLDAEFDAAMVNLNALRTLTASDDRLRTGYIPTLDGIPRTVLSGWVWVVVTTNAERQEGAVRFLNWMADANRQGEYAQLVGALPTQRRALRAYPFDLLDAETVEALLARAVFPLGSEYSAAARAMQSALVAVLNGVSTAEAAAQTAVSQFAD